MNFDEIKPYNPYDEKFPFEKSTLSSDNIEMVRRMKEYVPEVSSQGNKEVESEGEDEIE